MCNNTVYGLSVEYNDCQHEEYMLYKNMLQKSCQSVKKCMIREEQKGTIPSVFLKLNQNEYFSFCVCNKNIYLGIYNTENQTLSRNCSFNDIKKAKYYDFENLEYRAENIIHSKCADILHESGLNKAWGREIVKMKSEAIDFPSTSIFEQSFEDALANVKEMCEKLSVRNETRISPVIR